MCATRKTPNFDQLFEAAESQQGFFSARQAVDAGYARSTHSYHVEAGNWVREHRGIYRLRRYPQGSDAQLVLWSLWSRNRAGLTEGVYSHLTALRIKDLSDANPSRLHCTVPPNFRRNGEVPPILVLHKSMLAPSEVIKERGYAITTPIRAIVDLAKAEATERDTLRQALHEGKARGLITQRELAEAHARNDVPTWLRRMMEQAA